MESSFLVHKLPEQKPHASKGQLENRCLGRKPPTSMPKTQTFGICAVATTQLPALSAQPCSFGGPDTMPSAGQGMGL